MRTLIGCTVVLNLLVVATGCDRKPVLTGASRTEDLASLTREGCVQTDTMRARLDESLTAMKLPLSYQVLDLASLKANDPRIAYPTPTLLFANVDLFGMPTPTPPYPEPT